MIIKGVFKGSSLQQIRGRDACFWGPVEGVGGSQPVMEGLLLVSSLLFTVRFVVQLQGLSSGLHVRLGLCMRCK